jgi:translation elongation factor EF-1alpha
MGPRPVDAPLRIPLTTCYKIKVAASGVVSIVFLKSRFQGTGTVVAGRILSGSIAVGDEVVLAGVAAPLKVKSLEIFHSSRARAMAGDVVGICVAVPKDTFERGMVLCRPKDGLKATTCFVAQLRILPQCVSTIKVPLLCDMLCHALLTSTLKAGYRPFAFCCTATFSVRFEALLSKVDKAGKVIEESPAQCRGGDIVLVRLTTESPVTLEAFPSPLGRFLLRDANETVCIGRVHTVEAAQPKAQGALVKLKKKGHFR